MKRPETYIVEWEDSASPPGVWMDRDSDVLPVRAVTAGFLVKKTRTRITMASSLHDTQAAGVMAIPRSAIRSMKRLR